MHQQVQDGLLEAALQLKHFHTSRGVECNTPSVLFWSHLQPDRICNDEPSFYGLLRALKSGDWDAKRSVMLHRLLALPKRPCLSVSAIRHNLIWAHGRFGSFFSVS